MAVPPPPAPPPLRRGRVLLAACAIHVLHDGFLNSLYVLFPLMAAEFGLSYAQVGLMKTTYSAALSLFQIPAGLLAEVVGEVPLLLGGTAALSGSLFLVGSAAAYAALLAALAVGGTASGVQHPLASSLVATAYEAGGWRRALGTYNFSGDLGKIFLPAASGLLAVRFGWRGALLGLAGGGLFAVALLFLAARSHRPFPRGGGGRLRAAGVRGWGVTDRRRFAALAAVGMVDDATRTAVLTFLPFLLAGKGLSTGEVGVALMLLFAGGAFGKYACGAVAERAGVAGMVAVTEALTGAGILGILFVPTTLLPFLLPPFGMVLNGTSSVLYATVAEITAAGHRSRVYGLYYTLYLGAGAVAPVLWGLVSDRVGLPATWIAVAGVILGAVALALPLRARRGGAEDLAGRPARRV